MMFWTDHDLGATDWLLMGLTIMLFWGGLIVVTVMVARQLMSRSPQDRRDRSEPADPLQLLDERLARGEIDPEDYLRRRDLLSGADRGLPSETS